MQAIIVSALGDSSSLQLIPDAPVPQAAPGHALIKLQFSGVNYIDTYFRSGLYPTQLPYTPGASARNTLLLFIIAARASRIHIHLLRLLLHLCLHIHL